MSEIILTTKTELRNEILAALRTFETIKKKSQPQKLYTVNQVAKTLGKAHATIKKLVQAGLIQTTKNGLITEDSLNDYLKGK